MSAWLEFDVTILMVSLAGARHVKQRARAIQSSRQRSLRPHRLGGVDTIARDLVWDAGVLLQQVQTTARQAAARAQEVSLTVDSLSSYVSFLQHEHAVFMQRHPRAAVSVWKEILLAAMLRGDKQAAAEIARARIVLNDSGGFQAGGRSFYERALALNAQ